MRVPSVSDLVRPETTHDEFEDILKFVTECEQNYLIKICLDEFNSHIWENTFNKLNRKG